MKSNNIRETVSVNMSANGDSPDDIITMMNRIFAVGGQKPVTQDMMPKGGPIMPMVKTLDVVKNADVDEAPGDQEGTKGTVMKGGRDYMDPVTANNPFMRASEPSAPAVPNTKNAPAAAPPMANPEMKLPSADSKDPIGDMIKSTDEEMNNMRKLAGLKHDAITDEDSEEDKMVGNGSAKTFAPGTVPNPGSPAPADTRSSYEKIAPTALGGKDAPKATPPGEPLTSFQQGAAGRAIAQQAATPAGQAQSQAAGLNASPAERDGPGPTPAPARPAPFVEPTKFTPPDRAEAPGAEHLPGGGVAKTSPPTATGAAIGMNEPDTDQNKMPAAAPKSNPTPAAGAAQPFKPTIGAGGKVSADQLNQFRQSTGNQNATLGQYMNAAQGKTAIAGGKNDPANIQKNLGAGQTAYNPATSKGTPEYNKAINRSEPTGGAPKPAATGGAPKPAATGGAPKPAAAPTGGAPKPAATGGAPKPAAAPTPPPRPANLGTSTAPAGGAPKPAAAAPAASPIGIPTAPKVGGGAANMAPSSGFTAQAPAAKPTPTGGFNTVRSGNGPTQIPTAAQAKPREPDTIAVEQYRIKKAEYDQLLAEYTELKRIKDLARGIQQLDERGPSGGAPRMSAPRMSAPRMSAPAMRPNFGGQGFGNRGFGGPQRGPQRMPNLNPRGRFDRDGGRNRPYYQQQNGNNFMQQLIPSLFGGALSSLTNQNNGNPQGSYGFNDQPNNPTKNSPQQPDTNPNNAKLNPLGGQTTDPNAIPHTFNAWDKDMADKAKAADPTASEIQGPPTPAQSGAIKVGDNSYRPDQLQVKPGVNGTTPNSSTPSQTVNAATNGASEKTPTPPPVAVPTTNTNASSDEVKAAVAPRIAADAEKRASGGFDIKPEPNATTAKEPDASGGVGRPDGSMEEEFANEPNPRYKDVDYMNMMLAGGLNSPKKTYPKVSKGDNPMQQVSERVLRDLKSEFEKFKNEQLS